MAVTTNSNARKSTENLIHKKWNHTSPERNMIWIEPKPNNKALKSVPVIYYISRNGQLEHPHFIEVPLSFSDEGLYLRDVINRLNFLRGKGMGYLFSWSCKRSYKNGYVWHDLSENDLIHPTNGQDYVLKGSEILETSISSRFCEISLPELQKSPSSDENRDSSSSSSTTRRRRNQSWSSFENPQQEYRLVYKCESGREIAGKFMSATAAAADAATQTEEKRRKEENKMTELSREDSSPSPPPPSMSSSDGMDGADGSKRVSVGDRTAEIEFSSGRMSASRVVMHLITCGSSTSADNCSTVKSTKKSRSKNFHYDI
ncbi:hypothetical protein EJD97_007065 [Solanum chilense]|uniref:SOSEKI DIX-like domain-containing protein n=1 Tax=Solanum chilense TaxID=4083 RepID=A0A6N2AHQ6_SOLCI|nr:hypothetical protein EJD97_007065 [Solanum chilense]